MWTVDYIRGHDHQVIPYEDDNEDQDVEPGCILNYGYRDELSVDNGVYDGHYIPGYCDVDPPLKDMYVLTSICIIRVFRSLNVP